MAASEVDSEFKSYSSRTTNDKTRPARVFGGQRPVISKVRDVIGQVTHENRACIFFTGEANSQIHILIGWTNTWYRVHQAETLVNIRNVSSDKEVKPVDGSRPDVVYRCKCRQLWHKL